MAVTTKKTFDAVGSGGQSSTTVFTPVSIELNNQDDLDVYVTLSGGTRVLNYRQSTGSTTDSNHPQVNDTTGLYFPAQSAGVTLQNYTLSTDSNTITFNSALPSGAVVSIERRTRDSSSDYTNFVGGSTIRHTDVNRAFDESNFTAQEARNKAFDIENKIFGGPATSTSFISSDEIVDGTIVNTDISDTAEIAVNKLAQGSNRQILQSSGTDVEWTSNVDIPGTLDVTGNSTLDGNLTVTGTTTAAAINASGAVGVDGNFDVNTNKFQVAASNGNTTVGGTLNVSGTTTAAAVNASGAVGVDGNFDVNTNKFTVNATSGNTLIAGDLDVAGNFEVTGTSLHTGQQTVPGGAQVKNIKVGLDAPNEVSTTSGNLVLDSSSGTVQVTDHFQVTGNADVDNNLNVDGTLTVDGVSTLTGAVTATGGVTGDITGDVTGDVSGNAGTATALQNARTIGGVSFNGTANINLPGVNTAGNQNTSGNAATATDLAAATKITASEQGSHTGNDTTYFTTGAADARYFNISSGDTIKDGDTFPDNDTTIATTAAINDRIVDLIDDVGGFVPIANETSFPNANPDVNNGTGTLVSIKALSSNLTSNGSGVATIANGTVGNSTVTITGLANSTTYASTFGMIVETTTTLNTYTFHRQVPKATEVTTVAGSVGNVNTVAGSISNVNAVAGNATNINAVAGNATNINAVAGNASNINSVVAATANINTAVNNATSITTVATNIGNVNNTGNSIANVNTVASNISDVNNFADLYQIGTSAPSTDGGGNSLAAGDLWFDSSSNKAMKVHDGTNFTAVTPSQSVLQDISIVSGNITYAEDLGLITSALTTGSGNSIETCADNITKIQALGTTAAVADMALLGDAGVIADMAILGTADVVSDLNTLGTADVVSDMNTLATTSNVNNLNTVAGISSNVNTVAGVSSNVTTVAGISSNVTSVAGISSDVTAVAGKATEVGRLGTVDAVADLNTLGTTDVVNDMNTLATTSNVNNMNTVAGISSNVSTVAGVSGNVTSVAGIASNVTSVAGIASNVTTVAGISSDVTAVANDATDIGAVAGKATEIGRLGTADAVADMNTLGTTAIVSDMDTLADISSNITTVAGIASNVTSVAGNASNINSAVSNASNINSAVSNASNINSAVSNASNINTVAANNSNVTTVAGKATEIGRLGTADAVADLAILGTTDVVADLNTLATSAIISDMDTLADISANITTVAGISGNVTSVAGNATNINAVAADATDIGVVAGKGTEIGRLGTADAVADMNTLATTSNVANMNTVAGGITNVNNVGGSISNVNTVAGAIADVNRYANEYKIASSAPSSPSEGDLWYDDTNNVLKYYNGSAWETISSGGILDVVQDTTPQLGGNLDAQTRNITNGGTFTATTFSGDLNGTINTATTATTQSASNNSTKVATTAYVDSAVSNVVDSAPSALNTLNELAAALGDDANYAATTATTIGTKLPKAGGEMTGNITFSGSQTVDGRDLSADGSKLDGIASSANNYSHPNHSGEVTSSGDGATTITDNVVDEANLKISNTGSNGQYLQKQSGNTGGLTWASVATYSVGDGGLTQNNFTNTLKSKLDGIEASATADQTAAEIRTLVEAASNSNVFTDADHSKLNGIEASATADQTASEIVSLISGQTIAPNVITTTNLTLDFGSIA